VGSKYAWKRRRRQASTASRQIMTRPAATATSRWLTVVSEPTRKLSTCSGSGWNQRSNKIPIANPRVSVVPAAAVEETPCTLPR
jgi:hypothetical protein